MNSHIEGHNVDDVQPRGKKNLESGQISHIGPFKELFLFKAQNCIYDAFVESPKLKVSGSGLSPSEV